MPIIDRQLHQGKLTRDNLLALSPALAQEATGHDPLKFRIVIFLSSVRSD